MVDPNTNRTYYWMPGTKTVVWTLPPGGVVKPPETDMKKEEEEAGETVDELMENYPYVKKTVVLPEPCELKGGEREQKEKKVIVMLCF